MKTPLVLFALLALASGNQHLVCKNIDDVFSSDAKTGSETSRKLQGPPGKKGIPGRRGRTGLPGPPGQQSVVDYPRIEGVINETVQRELVEVNANLNGLLLKHAEETDQKITEMIESGVQREVAKLEAKFQKLENRTNQWLLDQVIAKEKICRDRGDLFHNGVCYIAILERTNKAGATEKCKRIGGLLAEIHTREQETALMEYIRPKLSSRAHFWVGMTYQNPNIRYRSGKEIRNEQFQWRSGYPYSDAKRTDMYLLIYKPKTSNDGLWNDNYSYDDFYTICEKTI